MTCLMQQQGGRWAGGRKLLRRACLQWYQAPVPQQTPFCCVADAAEALTALHLSAAGQGRVTVRLPLALLCLRWIPAAGTVPHCPPGAHPAHAFAGKLRLQLRRPQMLQTRSREAAQCFCLSSPAAAAHSGRVSNICPGQPERQSVPQASPPLLLPQIC